MEKNRDENNNVSWWHVSKKEFILMGLGLLVIGVIQYQNSKFEEENSKFQNSVEAKLEKLQESKNNILDVIKEKMNKTIDDDKKYYLNELTVCLYEAETTKEIKECRVSFKEALIGLKNQKDIN